MLADGGNRFDILIIGGGAIGMCLARELAKQQAGKIALIERGALGAESSWAAAGMLSPQAEAEEHSAYFDLCYGGRGIYDDFAAELEAETGLAVNLETSGTLNVSFSEADSQKLAKIHAWQIAAGLPVEKLTRDEVLRLEPHLSPLVREALFFPRDAQIDNRLLMKALAASLAKRGVSVFENTEVSSLLTAGAGGRPRMSGASTGRGDIFAQTVVLATGAWTSFIKHPITAGPIVDVQPVRGQMISFAPAEPMFRHVIYIASGYAVPRIDGRVLVGATVENAGFTNTVTSEGREFLLTCAQSISPALANIEISENWSGLRPKSPGIFPVIDRVRSIGGLFVSTAHYRNGILLAPLSAKLMTELILKGQASDILEFCRLPENKAAASAVISI